MDDNFQKNLSQPPLVFVRLLLINYVNIVICFK